MANEHIKKKSRGRPSFRLDRATDAALALYMLDHHLVSRSELYRRAVGEFLEREGYLIRTKDGYEVVHKGKTS